MGFADPYPTPDKERVVDSAGIINNALGGSKGKIITVANNKIGKSVFGVKIGFGGRDESGSVKKRSGRGSGGAGDNGRSNKFEDAGLLGLVVEGGFKKLMIAATVEIG